LTNKLVTWTGGPAVALNYGYDPLGYGYDVVGNLQTLRYSNGVTNLYQYDSRNRLTSLVWQSGGTQLASFAYTVAPTGNRTALTETVNGSGPSRNPSPTLRI
jgi:hypothetical protein